MEFFTNTHMREKEKTDELFYIKLYSTKMTPKCSISRQENGYRKDIIGTIDGSETLTS